MMINQEDCSSRIEMNSAEGHPASYFCEIFTRENQELRVVYSCKHSTGFFATLSTNSFGEPGLYLVISHIMEMDSSVLSEFQIIPQWDLSLYSEMKASKLKFDDLDLVYEFVKTLQAKYPWTKAELTPAVVRQAWNRYLCESVVKL